MQIAGLLIQECSLSLSPFLSKACTSPHVLFGSLPLWDIFPAQAKSELFFLQTLLLLRIGEGYIPDLDLNPGDSLTSFVIVNKLFYHSVPPFFSYMGIIIQYLLHRIVVRIK